MYFPISFSYFLILVSVFSLKAQSQDFKIPDSLKRKSFKELKVLYYNNKSNRINDSIIANTYMRKAISKKDTLKIATAYCFLTSATNNILLKDEYLDTAIQLTKNNPSYSYPSFLYSLKAGLYEEKKDYKNKLNYFILAHDSALEVGNMDMVSIMRYNIGVSKLNIGMYKDALTYAIDSWKELKDEKVSYSYLNSLFLISSAYTNNSRLDSASVFNNLGINKSLEIKSDTHLSRFSLLEGVNQFHKSKYEICIDSLNNSLPQLIKDKDYENVAISYYFLGNSYSLTKNSEKSIQYLKRMDSIFLSENIVVPYCRDGYKQIIKYYKYKNDLQNQLKYTTRLLKLDSILDVNYQYFTSNIYEKYEKPRLRAEKQFLIESLKKDKSSFKNYLKILALITIVICLGFILSIYKRRKDFKKFSEIIAKLDNEIILYKKENTTKNKKNIKSDILNIDKEIIENILLKLNKFEEELGFLNKKITLQTLSKKIGTNTKYLSKVVNTFKEKSFSNYINDLRVEYAVNRLYNDMQFRKYSIEAIADDLGFKSSRSFFGVFQKKMGISPSYYISQLNKDLIN